MLLFNEGNNLKYWFIFGTGSSTDYESSERTDSLKWIKIPNAYNICKTAWTKNYIKNYNVKFCDTKSVLKTTEVLSQQGY